MDKTAGILSKDCVHSIHRLFAFPSGRESLPVVRPGYVLATATRAQEARPNLFG